MATNIPNPKFNLGGIAIIISHLYSEILKRYIYMIECHGEISIYTEDRFV